MIYMTMLHWIVVAVFLLVFFILVILTFKEQNVKTRLSMIFSAFLLVFVGIGFSIFALDKYTKKGKLISTSQQRDYRTESIIIKGKIKNVGKFKIGYCKIEVTMSNDTSGMKSKRKSYFTPSKSLDGLLGSKSIKSNLSTEEFLAVSDLAKNSIQSFKINMKYPPHFKNPKYKYKLFCH